MVKIQKPKPKTLTQDKGKMIEKSKHKVFEEVLSKKIKPNKKEVIIKDFIPPKIPKATKADNVIAAVQNQVIELKKKNKLVKDIEENPKIKKEKTAKISEIPKSTKITKLPLKRPLVLAPPESPIPTPMPIVKTKKTNAALKKKLQQEAVQEQKQHELQQKIQKKQANANNAAETKPQQQELEVKAIDVGKVKKFKKSVVLAAEKTQIKKSKKPAVVASDNKTTAATAKTQQNKLKKSKAQQEQQKKEQKPVKTADTAAKKQKPQLHVFKPFEYNEEAFNKIITLENIKKVAEALKQQVEADVTARKTRIFSDYRYLLNVACFKISNVPKRMVKLSLKHSLVDDEDDVVIIVTDLQRGSKIDYEPTKQHYEDVFREAGIKQKLTVVPFNQLKKEYYTFEAVRKFGITYDYFLCDSRIVGHVVGFCGKTLQKPRTTFHAIRLYNRKSIKNEFEKSLRRTAFKQLSKGNLISIPIGNHNFTSEKLAENVLHVVEELKTLYPGGLGNIRNMSLKIAIIGTISLPIYMSLAQAPTSVPYVVGPREKRMLKLKKKANAVLSSFVVNKDADIIKLNKKKVEIKKRAKEMRAALLASKKSEQEIDVDDHDEKSIDNDGNSNGMPAKRARIEPKVGCDVATGKVDEVNLNDDIEDGDEHGENEEVEKDDSNNDDDEDGNYSKAKDEDSDEDDYDDDDDEDEENEDEIEDDDSGSDDDEDENDSDE